MSQAAFSNRITRSLAPIAKLPAMLRTPARSFALGRVVKFVGTAGLRIEELTFDRAVVSVENRTKVQNHIGGVHAAAMALIAETATGFVVGMNVPDSAVPVIKSMNISFVRRAKGALRAVAELSAEQIERIRTTDKGDVDVKVTVTDEDGQEPIKAQMIWAWTPKRK